MKILQFTTYRLSKPDHGGKLRSYQLREGLRKRFVVKTLSVEWGASDKVCGFEVTLNRVKALKEGIVDLVSDIAICEYIRRKPRLATAIQKTIKLYNPAIVLLEQPYLWPLVKQFMLNSAEKNKPFMIYSSHNYETEMKQEFYNQRLPKRRAAYYARKVMTVENESIKNADCAIAVTQIDANYISRIAPRLPVQIFPNGHTRPVRNRRCGLWRRRFKDCDQNWVFVGSWHPPNINGLLSILRAMPDRLDNNKLRIWVLGSAANGLKAEYPREVAVDSCYKLVGPLPSADIDAAIVESSGVVIPIWQGGGSNLKTAQALLSKKCVVASPYAFRGFSHYKREPGVFIYNNPRSLAKALTINTSKRLYNRSAKVKALEWKRITQTLPKFVSAHLDCKQHRS